MVRAREAGRIYWRDQGNAKRAYADFRDYADVGGRQEALIPPGERRATSDPDIAAVLVVARLEELQERRKNKVLLGLEHETDLGSYVVHHLIEKKKARRVTTAWVADLEQRLKRAITFFEGGGQREFCRERGIRFERENGPRELASIKVRDVQQWTAALSETRSGKKGEDGKDLLFSPGTVRHYLNALSNLYVRAQSEGCVPPGYNPVQAMMDKPTGEPDEADWLEVDEAALLIESARTHDTMIGGAVRCIYPLLATFLLTGGRKSEVLGLEVADVSFDRRTIRFRNQQRRRGGSGRRLKTNTSSRTVPLWPQLEELLRPYVFDREAPLGRLLFPASRLGGDQPITDFRKALDAIAVRAGWRKGEIRSKAFRHTYCAARLQTLDGGAPVSLYTVAREMGHGGDALVKRIYGHLGHVRHRASAVEYRIQQHQDRDRIKTRLRELRAHQ